VRHVDRAHEAEDQREAGPGDEQQSGEGDGVEQRHDEVPRIRRDRPSRSGVREEHHPQRQCDECGSRAEYRQTAPAAKSIPQ
jgi:hypothetical protein